MTGMSGHCNAEEGKEKMEKMIKYLDLKRINAMHDKEIREAIDNVFNSGWYLRGEATQRFETDYAHYIGTEHCISVGNGLDALTLILRAYIEMGVMHEGDEIIVPANTFIATILSITENRLKPVLIEPWISTMQINETLIEDAITPRTRAIMLVHLYGRCAYTPGIGEICERYHLKLIEDNAQAHGCIYEHSKFKVQSSKFKVQRTGSLGHAAAHSFYPGKNLGALGDAGAVTTNDTQLASLVRSLGNYGYREKYVSVYKGRNSRMDEFQAAVLDVKLKYLDADNARRKEIAQYYLDNIKNPEIRLPNDTTADCVWHIFPVLCSHRDKLQQYLKEHGVETAIHYPIPPHKQQCYKQWHSLSLPITEHIHQCELSLPCHQAMTDEEASVIVELLNQFK